MLRRAVLLLLLAVLAPAALQAAPVAEPPALEVAPLARPEAPAASDAAAVCRSIAAAARESALDAGFFARLLWRESLFRASAVSPAGAQGIAQFMPGTARERGLADAFDTEAAVRASAAYLAELARTYGNLGLAAAAYNGGEARLERFLTVKAGLPPETRAYVQAITGYSAETWRDAPPGSVDLSLDGAAEFEPACVALAATRGKSPTRARPALPWGVVIASNRDLAGAERRAERLRHRHASVLATERFAFTSGWRPGMSRLLHYAQVGRDTRAEAQALCNRLLADGADCLVLRN